MKSLKPKLKALDAINKITTVQFDTATAESQENEMFDADVDAAESSNILPEPTSTQTATRMRPEQQTIDFFQTHFPHVNFSPQMPARMPPRLPQIKVQQFQPLYCPTFVGGMPMTSLRYQAGMLLQNTALRQRPRTQDKIQRKKRRCKLFCKLEYYVGSKTRMKKGIERYCSIVGCLNEAFIEEGVKIEYLREDTAVLEDTAAGEVSIMSELHVRVAQKKRRRYFLVALVQYLRDELVANAQ